MHFELILAERENTDTEQGFRGSQYMLIPKYFAIPGHCAVYRACLFSSVKADPIHFQNTTRWLSIHRSQAQYDSLH